MGVMVGVFLTGAAGVLAIVTVSVSAADPWSEYLANATGLAVLSCALLLLRLVRLPGAVVGLGVLHGSRPDGC